ncbi:type II secretion system protein [Shewanella sp. NIFS-20-20]|uniref:type II secretion system protein n=1 Tax=Shewanella sp. NIFS-20-20 TaxID=2853806 RepID=UPI001C450EB0|nr:prepilin-type N-terminal cleavage/methylation domain-containing protein [Shewanella sp. NIFS-20-20]MBV7317386.1 prepilin-type N-terminal cleavage/methylation domain-containing protein [Shewanella sp. NIFS-20-20]
MKQHTGFTLIELVVVIIILGILAVTAAPKFINLQSDARTSALEGVKGAIQGANSLIYSKASLQGIQNAATGSVDINGDSNDTPPVTTDDVAVVYGYMAGTLAAITGGADINAIEGTGPTAAGNSDWVIDSTTTAGSAQIWQRGAPTTCFITYTQAASAGALPTFTALPDASDC